jgi:hypothetical protein
MGNERNGRAVDGLRALAWRDEGIRDCRSETGKCSLSLSRQGRDFAEACGHATGTPKTRLRIHQRQA